MKTFFRIATSENKQLFNNFLFHSLSNLLVGILINYFIEVQEYNLLSIISATGSFIFLISLFNILSKLTQRNYRSKKAYFTDIDYNKLIRISFFYAAYIYILVFCFIYLSLIHILITHNFLSYFVLFMNYSEFKVKIDSYIIGSFIFQLFTLIISFIYFFKLTLLNTSLLTAFIILIVGSNNISLNRNLYMNEGIERIFLSNNLNNYNNNINKKKSNISNPGNSNFSKIKKNIYRLASVFDKSFLTLGNNGDQFNNMNFENINSQSPGKYKNSYTFNYRNYKKSSFYNDSTSGFYTNIRNNNFEAYNNRNGYNSINNIPSSTNNSKIKNNNNAYYVIHSNINNNSSNNLNFASNVSGRFGNAFNNDFNSNKLDTSLICGVNTLTNYSNSNTITNNKTYNTNTYNCKNRNNNANSLNQGLNNFHTYEKKKTFIKNSATIRNLKEHYFKDSYNSEKENAAGNLKSRKPSPLPNIMISMIDDSNTNSNNRTRNNQNYILSNSNSPSNNKNTFYNTNIKDNNTNNSQNINNKNLLSIKEKKKLIEFSPINKISISRNNNNYLFNNNYNNNYFNTYNNSSSQQLYDYRKNFYNQNNKNPSNTNTINNMNNRNSNDNNNSRNNNNYLEENQISKVSDHPLLKHLFQKKKRLKINLVTLLCGFILTFTSTLYLLLIKTKYSKYYKHDNNKNNSDISFEKNTMQFIYKEIDYSLINIMLVVLLFSIYLVLLLKCLISKTNNKRGNLLYFPINITCLILGFVYEISFNYEFHENNSTLSLILGLFVVSLSSLYFYLNFLKTNTTISE